MPLINKTVLVSGAEYFTDKDAINALMDSSVSVDLDQAVKSIIKLLRPLKRLVLKLLKLMHPKECRMESTQPIGQ